MKIPTLVSTLVLALTGALSAGTHLDAPLAPPRQAPSAAEADWDALLDSLGPASAHSPSPRQDTGVGDLKARSARTKVAEDLAREAALLRAFQEKHRDHPLAREARHEEAVALLQAGFLGDDSSRARREELVAQIRFDTTIPTRRRSEVAAMSDNLAVARRSFASPDARLAAQEQAVRGLIREFPDVPTGYRSLLRIAQARSEEYALFVAAEILEMPAPAPVVAEAQRMFARHDLVGRPLAQVLPRTGFEELVASTAGRPALLYTWSISSPASLDLAARLAAETAPGVALVGINLDRDIDAARATVAERRLPGLQRFDGAPAGGLASLALVLEGPGQVYAVDAQGFISSISSDRTPGPVRGSKRR
jgi:hypothetical protein